MREVETLTGGEAEREVGGDLSLFEANCGEEMRRGGLETALYIGPAA